MKSRALIEACVQEGLGAFIFSSTATVYSADAKQPLAEGESKEPISPYARSKLMTEWMLEDASRAHGLRAMSLRYFNVAGADPEGRSGQSAPMATHLIKRAAQVVLGRVPHLDIFGTDYPTPDGTGIRDYIHVSDLIGAHLLALDALSNGAVSATYNVGLRPRLERARSGAGYRSGDRAAAAGEGKSAPRRRSADTHFRSFAHQERAWLAAAPRGFVRDHPLRSEMGAPAERMI